MHASVLPEIDSALFSRFGDHYSDYRLYPNTSHFVEAFDACAYLTWLGKRKSGYFRRPLSLYVHIPFCRSQCFYCRSNQIITTDTDNIKTYLDYLLFEIRLQGQLFKEDPKVDQLYLGGGTPTFLSVSQLNSVMQEIQQNFSLLKDGEFCIEIDARQMTGFSSNALREMGFNCAIIGVQDFDQQVQQSIHRMQDENATLQTIRSMRQAGFRTIRIELIYGLPKQDIRKFEYTLKKLIAENPDQIRLLHYLHLPEKFRSQRNIASLDLPDTRLEHEMTLLAIANLIGADYVHIGMNLFAKQDDRLTIAQRQGLLHYGLQGYSVYPDCDCIALGISGIGSIGPALYQNYCDLDRYYDQLEQHKLPIMRGAELNADDLIRRSVMQALICQSVLSFESVETFFPIEFERYFAMELKELLLYEQAGLITLKEEEITVTPKGRLLIGSICKVFDKYRRNDREREYSSQVI